MGSILRKRIQTGSLLVLFLLAASIGWGQGFEDFTNSNAGSSGYSDGAFVGNNGITWSYLESRDEANTAGVNAPALMLRRIIDDSKVTSSSIPNGIGDFSVKLYKGFTGSGDREVELFVNGTSYGTSTPFDDFDEHVFTVTGINTTGDIIIEIRNITSDQVIVDDITWTAFGEGENTGPLFSNISQLPSETSVTSSDAVMVSADIIDGDDIDAAELHWGTTSGSLINTIAMTSDAGDTYAINTAIPAQADGTTVYYEIEATDSNADEPATSTSTEQSYTVADPLPFNIPYSNGLRNQTDLDEATNFGFEFNNTTLKTSAGGYIKIDNGSIVSPAIDFSTYDALSVYFDMTTFGGDNGQELSILVSNDNGGTYTSVGAFATPPSYETTQLEIDLSSLNGTNGRIKFEMTGGSASIRFRDLDISNAAAPQYPPVIDLNSAADYGILAATGISSAGASVISNTNIGVSPGERASITGFPPSIVVNGEIHASDDAAPVPAMLAQAHLDLEAAYNFAAGASTPAPATVAGDQGGLTLYPGIYKSTSTLKIQAGDLTLDAQGDPNARWIFQIASALTTIGGAGGDVILTGGAQAKNITWQVGSSVTIGNDTSFKGNILAYTSITFNTGSTADGRLYAMNGLVALSGDIIIDQPCVAPTNLAVSNITGDSAYITWTEGSNETEWEVSYGPTGFDPYGTQGTTVSVLTDPETTLNNLDGGFTDYDVYVRAICDVVNEIEWAGPVSFSISCGVATVPYLLDFDSVVVPNLPNCTSNENEGIGTDWKTEENISQFTGNVLNYSTHSIAGNANSWFYTQGVELVAGMNYQVSYRYGSGSSTSTESMKVAYGTSPDEQAMTNQLADYPTISTTAPLDELISFSVANDGVYYFGFNAYSSENQGQLYVDDINIMEEQNFNYIYEDGSWTPSDPNLTAMPADNIKVMNGTTSFIVALEVNDITVMSEATLNIEDVLTINGNIINNGSMVFKSTSLKDGELAAVPSSSSITGDMTVERYMSDNRAYRFVSSPVTTSNSIHANWQEGAISATDDPNPGYGTHITGTEVDQTNGFDATVTGNPSLFILDPNAADPQAFMPLGNTDMNTINAGEGYLIFVRGDRDVDLSSNDSHSETTLRTTGEMHTGTFTNNTNVSYVQGEYNIMANPYQSAVNINLVIADSDNLNNNFAYVYDPSLGTNGAYVTVDLSDGSNSSGSAANIFLQPGQAVQVATATNATTTSIVFHESAKSPGNHTATFRSTTVNNEKFIVGQLFTAENYVNGNPLHDSFKLMFDASFDNALTNEDAVKPSNFTENLGIGSSEAAYSVERRALPVSEETIALFMNNHEHQNYMLSLEVSEFDGLTAYLKDNFTGEDTELQIGQNLYSFTVNQEEPASIATTRFSIYFAEAALNVDNATVNYGIELYPNPTESGAAFYITIGQFEGSSAKVIITDIFGKRVYQAEKEFSNGKISIQPEATLSSGVYFVQLIQNDKKVVKRLMIK